jgi:hypothetical protein
MVQDPADRDGVGDVGNDLERTTAAFADERIRLKDLGEALTAALFSGYFGDVTRPSSFFRVMQCSVSRNEGRGRRGRL